MRIALLHTRLSGYLAACLRAYQRMTGAELLIYAWPHQTDAPFDPTLFADLGEVHSRRDTSDEEIEAAVRRFSPDAILTSGWADKGYVRICRSMRRRGVPVIAGCDTQWTGGLRQRVAGLTAPLHVQKVIDVLWVTGERQAVLARSLGFRGNRLWDGYYACDWKAFASAGRDSARTTVSAADRAFLFVGRYVPVKGLDTLLAAYRMYRGRVSSPWRLRCAGTGPLQGELTGDGVEDLGFIQPDALPGVMAGANAFVLPSRFEPWGVVAHEAAASGLPLILSDACGAGVHLLRHLYNGYSFPAGSAASLADAMVAMHELSVDRWRAFGQASFELSKQYTPQRWAETLAQGIEKIVVG